MKHLLDRKMRLAFGLSLFALFLMGALSYRWMVISDRNEHTVRHTHEVLENLQDLKLAMAGIDSTSRSFLLTGSESDLSNFGPSIVRAQRDVAAIRALTTENDKQRNPLSIAETLIAEQIQNAVVAIDLRRNWGVAAFTTAARASWDDSIENKLEPVTSKMQQEELRLLALRSAETDHDRSLTRWLLIFAGLSGIVFASIATRSFIAENARRKVFLAALQESEERSRILMDGIQDYAIFMVDPQGQVVNWSASAERMTGYPAKTIIGTNFSRLFSPQDIERGRPSEVLRITSESGEHQSAGACIRQDGTEFPANLAGRALKDAAGNLRGLSAILRDLTESTKSEARYQALLESAPDGMVVVNQNGEIVLVNAKAEKQFGYSRHELLGQKVSIIILKGFEERLLDADRTPIVGMALEAGNEVELRGQRKDGTEFTIEVSMSPLESAEGMLTTAAIRDITARKDAERVLAQMEARFRGLLEAAPDGMVVVNPEGEIILLNAQAERQFGYRRDELLGRKVNEIIPDGFAERLIADALRTSAEATQQQIGAGIELLGRRKDGSHFPIEILLSPLEGADGVMVTAAIRDISRRKLLERQLHQSQKMEAVGQLTGGIAHDFNNLLTVIIGNLGLLEMLIPDNEAAIKRIKTSQKAAARGADITRRLLVFSSNEELKPSFVFLRDSIQNLTEMASRVIGTDIKITKQLDQALPPLFLDPAAFESALLNLVVNARDAMPQGGSILISSEIQLIDKTHPIVQAGDLPEGRFICVNVTDTGQGMSRETLERACEPFFTTKAPGKGTGLGLAMVFGFVKQSGGVARMYSELGHGTTVSLYFPVVAGLAPSLIAPALSDSNQKLSGKVLVVDDESDLLELTLVYLTELGFNTLEAHDGASALKIVALHPDIDLIVTDIVMPGGMNGSELVQKARILRPTIKFIFSSGFPPESLAQRPVPLADGPFLRKPYRKAEFNEIVRRVMEMPALELTEAAGSSS